MLVATGTARGYRAGEQVFFSLPPLPHSSATNLHFQLHFQPGGKDFGIITSGGLVTPEAGTCAMGWASGTHQEPRDGGKAGGDKDMFAPGHTCGLRQGPEQTCFGDVPRLQQGMEMGHTDPWF